MRAVWALRSALFVAWLVLTVIPWALAVLLISVFARSSISFTSFLVRSRTRCSSISLASWSALS